MYIMRVIEDCQGRKLMVINDKMEVAVARYPDLNEEIKTSPEIINASPYEKGWFLTIEIENEDEKNNLLDAFKYSEYLKEQSK